MIGEPMEVWEITRISGVTFQARYYTILRGEDGAKVKSPTIRSLTGSLKFIHAQLYAEGFRKSEITPLDVDEMWC